MGFWITGIGGNRNGSHEFGGELAAEEAGRRTVSSADDADCTGLIRGKAQKQGEQICSEDTHLGRSAYQHQTRLGNQRAEVGHGSDSKEDQRGIPSHAHALIEDVQHGILLVDADLQSGEHGDVAYDHAESDGHEQQGFPVFLDAQEDEHQADADHRQVLPCAIGKTRETPELLETLYYGIHPQAMLAMSAPSSTESVFFT